MSIIPERVWLTPTFLITKSEPLTINPAATKNAAEEISPTTSISLAVNCEGLTQTLVPLIFISAPRYSKAVLYGFLRCKAL